MKSSLSKNTVVLSSALLLLLGATNTWASKPKKMMQETYSATESEEAFTSSSSPQPLNISRSAVRPAAFSAVKNATISKALPKNTMLAAITQPVALPVGKFDPVPSDQVDALSRRLTLVNELIRRHHRAYDYRAYTVQDLQTLVAQLDGNVAKTQEKPVMKAQAPEQPAPLPTPTEEDEVNSDESIQTDI
jgi:hypothetical protein